MTFITDKMAEFLYNEESALVCSAKN